MSRYGLSCQTLLFVFVMYTTNAWILPNNYPKGLDETLVRLGQVGNRIYFAETTALKTWPGAKKFCENSGMQLATIETKPQEDFLTEKSNITRYFMWTGGRDAHNLNQFVWESYDNKSLSSELSRDNIFVDVQELTCLGFSNRIYGLLGCNKKAHTLCEITFDIPRVSANEKNEDLNKITAVKSTKRDVSTDPEPMETAIGKVERLIKLGDVDGRIYFAETTVTKTWKEAKDFCQISGMELAAILTKRQENLLTGSNVTTDFMWTSGRDALSLDQLAWDSNNKSLSPELSRVNVQVKVPISTCLAFSAAEYGIFSCDRKCHTLCEIAYAMPPTTEDPVPPTTNDPVPPTTEDPEPSTTTEDGEHPTP